MADAALRLHKGTMRAGKVILDPDDRFLAPAFVKGLREGKQTVFSRPASFHSLSDNPKQDRMT